MSKVHYIREIAISKGLNLTQLAYKLGVTKATLSQNLKANMRLSTLIDIAKALDVDVPDLFRHPTMPAPTPTTQTSTDTPHNSFQCPYCGKTISVSKK